MNPYRSANAVLPKAYELAKVTPTRVVDIGCGDMGWLRAVIELGCRDVLGVDIEPLDHIPQDNREALQSADSLSFPYLCSDVRDLPPPTDGSHWRDSDLVICLETAEHLHPEHAEHLVELVAATLSTTRPGFILWSAAVPGQGPYGEPDNHGAHHNEQPSIYWEERFAVHGIVCDHKATRTLHEWCAKEPAQSAVDPWYRSNIGIYFRSKEHWSKQARGEPS